ncbi:MAG: PAS domain S-box protein [Acidobacteriota bacterium]
MKKLYYLYIALALFVLGTTFLALLLDRRITRTYATSAATSERATARRASFERLQKLSADANAPGNDVFDDGAIDAQATRMEHAYASFGQAMRSERARIARIESPGEAKPMLEELAEVDAAMRDLVAEGRLIFPALREKRTGDAASRMARMDRAYSAARKEMADLDAMIRRREATAFAAQARQADALRKRYTLLNAVLNVLSLLALVLYGRYMLRQLRVADERDKVLGDAIEGISFVDRQGRYTFVNSAFAAGLGYEPAELIGMPCAATIHPADLQTIIASFADARTGGKVERDVQAVRKGGGTLNIRIAVVASRGSDGTLLGHYCFAKDITEQKRAEAALRRSEERFHFAARATNDMVWEWDIITGHCWGSEALEHQFGYPFSGDVDKHVWYDAVHPNDVGRITARQQQVLASGEVYWSEEYRFRRGDGGGYAEVLDHGYCVRDAEGKPLRMIGAMRDITETKRAERAYNTQLLNAAADGIFAVDAEGRTAFVNQSAARMLGWTVAELLGKEMHSLAHHHHADGRDYPPEDCPIQKTRRTGDTSNSDREVFWKKDGSNVTVEYTSTPVRSAGGEITGAVVTFRDISERRFVEQMKDEFVSVVSHELRTPLTSIRGALGLLAAGRLGEIPEKGKRMLDIAVSNTDRLVRLINDILDIERMESGKALTLQPCDAGILMAQAIEMIRPVAEKAGVTLRWEACDAPLLADPDRLLQTFTNLLGNAVKFSPAGEVVSLTCSDSILFEVADRGRGIPADKLELIFERFQQVDASDSRERGGSGLGLPICRSIVRQHGGEIWAESGPGAGSRFRFTIPRAELAAVPAGTGRMVLVCDDDQPMRELLTAFLEQKGHRVAAVASGRELFDRLKAGAPDLILLDLLMPEMNGWETLARLKSDPATAAIPVVIISVFSADRSGRLFSDLAGWIQKPLDRQTVVDAVEGALPSAHTPKKVLLVEDDFDLARVVIEGLARHGIETMHAGSGRAAIELARTNTPDVLVLDLVLPDIDGFAVVDWLKDHDVLRSVPVIVYSGTETTPSQRERLKLGPTEFLTKARITPEEFEHRVIRLLDSMISGPPAERSHVA